MIAGFSGAFLVVSVNAWMNAPAGFEIVDGQVIDVDPLAAIFNSAAGVQFVHMYLAGVMVVGFTVAAVYAMGWLRGHHDALHRLGIVVPLTFAAIAAPIQPIVGHFAAQRLADEQPIKLAAMEGLTETTDRARLDVGGYWNGDGLTGAIEVPVDGLLSFMAQNDFDARVTGLDAVPVDDRPPVGIVHLAFQTMVAIGTALVGLAVWAAWRWRRSEDLLASTGFLRAIVVAGPAAVVAMETGWITTEVGRQPWVVNGLLRTEDAVTDAGYIWATLTILVIVYAAMTAGAVAVIRSMSARWRAGGVDLPSPYGPAALEPFEPDPVRAPR
jgi:cytochrome d ubiquinol oxidase subunit I